MATRNNPNIGATVAVTAGFAGIGWVAYRLWERSKLVKMLEAHPRPEAVMQYLGDPATVAADEITFTNMTSAEDAYADLIARIPAPGLLEGLVGEKGAGVVQEGKEFAQSLLEASKDLWGN